MSVTTMSVTTMGGTSLVSEPIARQLLRQDLDIYQHRTVFEIEAKLGKLIGEVSQAQVLETLRTVRPYRDIENSPARFAEFEASIKFAYADAASGRARGRNW